MIFAYFACFFAPLAFSLLVVNQVGRLMLGSLICGAASSVVVNSFVDWHIISVLNFETYYGGIIEEIPKTLFLFLAIFIFRKSITIDRIYECAIFIGIGFAIFENIYHIDIIPTYNSVFALVGRGISTSLMHSICVLLVAYGFIKCYKRASNIFSMVFGILGFMALAMICHVIYDILLLTDLGIIAFLAPLFAYLVLFLHHEFVKGDDRVSADLDH